MQSLRVLFRTLVT